MVIFLILLFILYLYVAYTMYLMVGVTLTNDYWNIFGSLFMALLWPISIVIFYLLSKIIKRD